GLPQMTARTKVTPPRANANAISRAPGRLQGEEALAAGMPTEDVHFAADAEMATPMLKSLVTADDVVLIKGSRGARLDRLVTALERD
ncbi:MAG: hypothetical protein R3300_21500, partial [Candidatus Promineifilaceae bacterium]|nr:hypothetical protein [Candidatus Promineifilaceae bacterium]